MNRLILLILLIPFFANSQSIITIDKNKTMNIDKTKLSNVGIIDNNIVYVSKKYGHYNNVHDALESITDASASNVYTILVDTGTWEFTQQSDFNQSGTFYNMFRTKDYVNIYGSGIDKTIFKASLPDTTNAKITSYSTIDFVGTQTVSDFTVISENIKYPIHDDFGSTNKVTINNCKLTNNGSLGYASATSETYSQYSYGCGTASGREIEFNNVEFNGCAFFHTNRKFSVRSKITFNECTFNPRDLNADRTLTTGALFNPLQSLKNDTVIFNNCDIDSVGYVNYVYQSDTNYVPYDLSEIDIVNYNTNYDFTVYNITETTAGSLMFVATDSLKFVSGTSTIFRDYEDLQDTLISKLEVGEWNLNTNLKMGVRLGDCSSINKSLTFEINGSEQTITFDEDFTSQTNTYILNFINNQITGATASLYDWSSYYTPF